MTGPLFPRFLTDPEQYASSERYWSDLWHRLSAEDRARFEWTTPWVGTGSPDIKDGNPIFSACSIPLMRGVRVIQDEPIGSGANLQAWLDTFGADAGDPEAIHELVISCTLSEATAREASSLMSAWVRGESINWWKKKD